MKNKTRLPLIIACAVLVTAGIVSIAWQKDSPKQKDKTYKEQGDTTKLRKKSLNSEDMKDLDKSMEELDREMAKLDVQLKGIDTGLISKSIKDAMASIYFEAINKEVKQSVQLATEQIKKIDWVDIKKNIDKAMDEAKLEISKIDFDKINMEVKAELDKAKLDQLDLKLDLSGIDKEIKDAMSNAKVEMGKAKEQLKAFKEFTDALEKDGLIDKKKGYAIRWKGDDLYINGKMQSKDISNKYRKYKQLSTHINYSSDDDNDNETDDKDTDSL